MRFKACRFRLYKPELWFLPHQNISKHLQNNMAFKIRAFATAAIFFLATWMLINGVHAQVTLSRDWNPGKRGESPEIHNVMKTVSAVCHLLINQIRQLANCENREEIDPGTPIFSARQ